MRRAIIITVSLLLVSAFMLGIDCFLSGHDEKLELSDIQSGSRTLTQGGVFTWKLKCLKTGCGICGYESEIEDEILYVSISATYDPDKALPEDGDGFVTITVTAGTRVKSVYFRSGAEKQLLSELET